MSQHSASHRQPSSERVATDVSPPVTAVVLAKNEDANIGKCLACLAELRLPTVVLDSGSTDRTLEVAARAGWGEVRPFVYRNHLAAYREITAELEWKTPWVVILDADMELADDLVGEIERAIRDDACDVVIAPVAMFIDGVPLPRGSLYPPKAVAFRRGQEYFVASGHGEQLAPGVRTATTVAKLVHNDLKPYEAYVLAQVRYGRQLSLRAASGDCRLRDRLRASTPLMGVAFALYSLVARGGLLSGRAGWAYAVDRIIAGLVQYRMCLEKRLAGSRAGGDAAKEAEAARF